MTEGKNKISIRRFHVVGGGCFGTQYVRWLNRARRLGMIEFESVCAVDRNPNCQLQREGLVEGDVQLVEKEWVDYFSDYLLENFQNAQAGSDHWVPSPLSSHILFLGFLRGIRRLRKNFDFEPEEFRESVPTPVRIPLRGGDLAVSFAEWRCPVNCIEPPRCPAIHAERTWDMKAALEHYFSESEGMRDSHVLQCRHLAHGVGTIPCRLIFAEFRRMLRKLDQGEIKRVTVATVSGCHGLIGQAKILRLQPQPVGQNTDQKKAAG